MVGIVIVSHSVTLAEGVKELAQQMTQGKVPIAVAGGIDDPDNPIGTDPIRVMTAIEEVQQGDGVLVLMDLGSALMSAETALDLLPSEITETVRLTAAPIVEGTMAAAVQASVGASLDTMLQEAVTSLGPKAAQLGLEEAVTNTQVEEPQPEIDNAQQLTVVVPNKLGLHARPVSRLVGLIGSYSAEVWLIRGESTVNAKSLNQIATLAIRQGESIQFKATGEQAEEVLQGIAKLATDNFGDIDSSSQKTKQATCPPQVTSGACGIPVSPGPAVGPVLRYRPSLPQVTCVAVQDAKTEVTRLTNAIDEAKTDISELERKTAGTTKSGEADIFAMHRTLLEDPFLTEAAFGAIKTKSCNAESAWHDVITEAAQRYQQLEDAYMRERAADIIDIGARVLSILTGTPSSGPVFTKPAILVAGDLGPSDVATLDASMVLGIVTEYGGATSHAAILARSLGIPAVAGAGSLLNDITDGSIIGLDGTTGALWLTPDAEQQKTLEEKRISWVAEQEAARSRAASPASTVDGKHIHVVANIGAPSDAIIAQKNGAEGVGLFRTEFLFLERSKAPTEEEQKEAYIAAAKALGGQPIIIRTLDIGGDKPISYLEGMAPEENPFLGKRGIRFCLAHKDIFFSQLRALLQAAAEYPIKIMLPMVAYPGELREARAIIEEAKASLKADGLPCPLQVPLGIMIEVPAAVALADQLAKEVDFFSIGTNDLTQYVMAADRGNAAVATLSDALHPAVLRMIRDTANAAHNAGIMVGMCGELAGNALAIPVLLGLGLDELSMNAPAIPQAKDVIRAVDTTAARKLATQALSLSDAQSVRELLEKG